MPLGASRIEVQVESATNSAAAVTLVSHGYSYLTRILGPAPGVKFSQNYLDLRDGQGTQVTVGGLPAGFNVEKLHITACGHP